MKITILLALMSLTSVYADNVSSNKMTVDVNTNKFKEVLSDFSFNYFLNYTGASPAGNYKNGATFNRFSGGYANGEALDSTGSTEIFQSFTLGYTFKNSMTLSYGVTMQESLTDDVKYDTGLGFEGTRSNGVSYNGHRTSLFIPTIASFSFGWISSSIFYQTPVASERNNGTIYVAGLQPSISFFSSIPGLRYRINTNVERLVIRDEKQNNSQGLRINIMPQISYQLTERFTLKKSFDFDWDQKGDQLGTTNFGKNMDDIGIIGIGANVIHKTFVDLYMTYSLSRLDKQNTALGASLNISI